MKIKSSFSNSQGQCLVVSDARLGRATVIEIYDDERPEETIWCTRGSFRAFVEGVKAGEFDGFIKEGS